MEDVDVKPMEYMMIRISGSQAGLGAYTLFKGLSKEDRKKLLPVLLNVKRTYEMP